MEDLFTLNLQSKSVIEINKVEVMAIPEFKRLVQRDRGSDGDHDGRKKYRALKELTFVWYYCSFKSPISHYEDKKRYDESLRIAGLTDSNVDGDVKRAIEFSKKYYSNILSHSLYVSAVNACNKLKEYFDGIDFTEEDDFGKRKHEPKDFISNIKNLRIALEELTKMKEMVNKELSGAIKVRGDNKRGNREDPDKK